MDVLEEQQQYQSLVGTLFIYCMYNNYFIAPYLLNFICELLPQY